jgi:hypothetical protein
LTRTRNIAYAGMFAGLYIVLTLALAPLSYGPVQFRLSELIKPLALFHPIFILSFGLGTLLSNLFSPFGVWDWGAMPLVDMLAGWVCWRLRRWPLAALLAQAALIALGVAVFPLGLGGGMPWQVNVLPVFVSQIAILAAGYYLAWKPRRDWWHSLHLPGF